MPVRPARKKFTLMELLIVVVILGVLAAILVPQASTASPENRRAELGRRLLDLRSQLALYKAQHAGRFPTADGTAAGAWDWSKLTARTAADGTAAPADATAKPKAFGPYFKAAVLNPMSDLADDRAAAVAIETRPLAAGERCQTPAGWVLDGGGQLFALTRTGERVYAEETPAALASVD